MAGFEVTTHGRFCPDHWGFIVADQGFQPGPQTHVLEYTCRNVAVPHQQHSHARRAVSYA